MLPLVARGIASLAGRMIARNPRLGKNLLSLFRKKPTGITLYRGEPAKPLMSLKDQAKHMYGKGTKSIFFGESPLRKAAAGRWFSSTPLAATGYAGRGVYSWKPSHWRMIKEWGGGYEPGIVKKVTLSAKELARAKKLLKKITKGDMSRYYVVPKSALPRIEKDPIFTAIANMRNMMGLKEGGLAGILNV
jgi:hypothetical protein